MTNCLVTNCASPRTSRIRRGTRACRRRRSARSSPDQKSERRAGRGAAGERTALRRRRAGSVSHRSDSVVAMDDRGFQAPLDDMTQPSRTAPPQTSSARRVLSGSVVPGGSRDVRHSGARRPSRCRANAVGETSSKRHLVVMPATGGDGPSASAVPSAGLSASAPSRNSRSRIRRATSLRQRTGVADRSDAPRTAVGAVALVDQPPRVLDSSSSCIW